MDEAHAFFDQGRETFEAIPPDVRKALAQKWAMKAVQGISDKATVYDPDEQARDHRRLIPLPAALSALQDLEAELVRTQILDVGDLLWKRYAILRELYRALHVSWTSVWKIVVGLWDYITGPSADELAQAVLELWAGIAACAGIITELISAKAFIAVALSVIHARNQCIATLRRKALPQPPAKRYRRRKVAR